MKKTWTGRKTLIEYEPNLTGEVRILRAYSHEVITIPARDLMHFVADRVRERRMANLESMSPADMLGVSWGDGTEPSE